jgi:hypothetical protein
VRLLAGQCPFAGRVGGSHARIVERDGADRLARCQHGKELGAVVVGPGEVHQARRADGAGRERSRVDGPAELLEHDGHVDHAATRAAVRFGNEEPRRAERGETAPYVVGRTALVVEQPPYICDRRLFIQETTHAGAQQLLIFTEFEVQAVGL